MYLISLTSNNTGFKNVYFNKRGLSIILGDQVDTTPKAEKNTFNGVGKSLLIELIHFCLGAEPTSDFIDKLKDWSFSLKFELDEKIYIATRDVVLNSKIVLNDNTMDIKDFNAFMGNKCFDKRIKNITTNDIAKLHAKYFDKKYFANRALSLLHLMFNLMETWGYRPKHSNPCDGIKKYKENARIRYLSKKELKLFFKEITHIEKNKPNSLYALSAIKLLFLTGARKNEILTCKWEYVDFEKHLIFLPDSKTGTKIIYLNTKAIKILKKLYNKPEREYSPYIIKNQLFTGHIVHIEHIWKMILKNSRIIDFRIHDIRHTVASHLISTGHNLSDVACILGHKSIMMSQKYAHLSSERAMNTCEAVSKIVKRSILADIF